MVSKAESEALQLFCRYIMKITRLSVFSDYVKTVILTDMEPSLRIMLV